MHARRRRAAVRRHRVAVKRDRPGPVFFRQERLGLRHARVHGAQVPHDDVGHRRGGAPRVHPRHDARVGDARPRTASTSSTAPTRSRRSAAGCARRASTSCRSSSTSCAATCRSSARGRASTYETEHFEPHHFERFLVPPGLTGLWQVTARARSTLRRGARHGRRLRPRLVARPRPVAPASHDHRARSSRSSATDGPPDERQRLVRRAGSRRASSASATGARTSSATCSELAGGRARRWICDLDRARARHARRGATRRVRARRPTSTTCSTTTSSTPSRSRRRSSTHYPLALRGARGRQARVRREAARRARRARRRELVAIGARSAASMLMPGPHVPLQPAA